MASYGNHEGFDPTAAELGGAELAPASIGTLESIATTLEELRPKAREYFTEHSVIFKGNPIVFKKYSEEPTDSFGEFTVYDKFCDREAMRYIICAGGTVLRIPGTLNGFNWDIYDLWEMDEGGIIEGVMPSHAQDRPELLSDLEVDDLSSAMFDLLEVPENERASGGDGVLKALEIAALRGVPTVRRNERHLMQGEILIPGAPAGHPDATFNDEIQVETFARDHVQPGLRTAIRSEVFIKEYIAPYKTRETTFITYENDTGHYNYDEDDSTADVQYVKDAFDRGETGPWFRNDEGELSEEIPEPRDFTYDQDFARDEREAKLAGLHIATEEQAQKVASTLSNMLARVK